MAPTTRRKITTAVATLLLETHHFGAPTASTRGIRAVSTIASSTMCAQRMLSASRKRQAAPSCRTRTL